MKQSLPVPDEIEKICNTFKSSGFTAYLIGGCVRDLLLEKTPKDWDITTNATPEEIQALFSETFYENIFGTVGIVTSSEDPTIAVVEATPYRAEGAYRDARRPESVAWSKNLSEDLKRRDFTVNAIAYDPIEKSLIDEHGGQEDMKRRVLRAVGEPDARFKEDALRMLRAIRLAAELDFTIEAATMTAIANDAPLLEKISRERVRDELVRLLMSDRPLQGLYMAQKLGIQKYIIPELEAAIGCEQNQAHSFDVYEHLLRSLQHAADKKWPLEVRLAALLHDIGKPPTRRFSEEKKDWTFHGHEVVGARMTKHILQNLKFSHETVEIVVSLVRQHMFFSDPDQITLSAVRRVIARVGKDRIQDLLNLRICDRIGTGRPKEQPFRLRKYMAMVDEAMRDPITVSMLKIDGNKLKELGVEFGPRIGFILYALLEEVLDEPSKNNEEYLEKRSLELMKLDDRSLKDLGDAGKDKRQSIEEEEVEALKKKHHVS
jgi:tRNA nucleotidyltransferase (CCA-adding enzyme)